MTAWKSPNNSVIFGPAQVATYMECLGMQTLEACSESLVWEMQGAQGKSILRMMSHAGSEADLEMPPAPNGQ